MAESDEPFKPYMWNFIWGQITYISIHQELLCS